MSQTYDFPRDEPVVFDLEVDERASFLTRTYAHLFGAIAAFVLIAIGLFQTSIPEQMTRFIAGNSWGWLLFLGGFMIVGMLASRAALQARTPPVQYLALGGFVAAEAIIFLPLLYIADRVAPGAIQSAALITLVGFAGLTGIVYFTRKDFSFLRGVVLYGGIVALLVIVGAVAFGLQLGMWFSVAMIAFRRRVDPLQHQRGDAPLPGGPSRGGGALALRVRGADVLVRAAVAHLAARVVAAGPPPGVPAALLPG
jgi:FtsH-binding integral membrane protein